MQTMIFYKTCQYVATESSIVLIGAPISKGEEHVKEIMKKEESREKGGTIRRDVDSGF